MTKIYFMLTSNSGVGSTTIFATRARRNIDDLLAFFSQYYDVSANYTKDKDMIDLLVLPSSLDRLIMSVICRSFRFRLFYFWRETLKK